MLVIISIIHALECTSWSVWRQSNIRSHNKKISAQIHRHSLTVSRWQACFNRRPPPTISGWFDWTPSSLYSLLPRNSWWCGWILISSPSLRPPRFQGGVMHWNVCISLSLCSAIFGFAHAPITPCTLTAPHAAPELSFEIWKYWGARRTPQSHPCTLTPSPNWLLKSETNKYN